jgi:hypothetical protein
MKIDIAPRNYNGQLHGYQEWYSFVTNKIWYRGNSKNGLEIGYNEDSMFKKAKFYIR